MSEIGSKLEISKKERGYTRSRSTASAQTRDRKNAASARIYSTQPSPRSDDAESSRARRKQLQLQIRFFKAARFCREKASAFVHPSLKIKQHGLFMQAMKGPCTLDREKETIEDDALSALAREAWEALGTMSPDVAMREYISIVDATVPGWRLMHMLGSADENSDKEEGVKTAKLFNWIIKVRTDQNLIAESIEIVKSNNEASDALLSMYNVEEESDKPERGLNSETGEVTKMTEGGIKEHPFLCRCLPLNNQDLILAKEKHVSLVDQALDVHSMAIRAVSDATIEWKPYKTLPSGMEVVQRTVNYPASVSQLKATARIAATPTQILSYLRMRFNNRLGLDKKIKAKSHEGAIHDAKSLKLMSAGGSTPVELNGKIYELSVKTNANYKTLKFPWPFQPRDVLWITVTGLSEATLCSLSFDWLHPALLKRKGYVRLRCYQQGYVAFVEADERSSVNGSSSPPPCSLSWLQCQNEGGNIPHVLIESYYEKMLDQPHHMALRFAKVGANLKDAPVGSKEVTKGSISPGVASVPSALSEFDKADTQVNVDLSLRDLLLEDFDSVKAQNEFHKARFEFMASDAPQRWVPYLTTSNGTQVFQRTFPFCARSPVKMTRAKIDASPRQCREWCRTADEVEEAVSKLSGDQAAMSRKLLGNGVIKKNGG